MLFRFLGLAFLEYCLFSLVCASPTREFLKIGEVALSSSSLPRGYPSRSYPNQKHRDAIQGTFLCPDGQTFDDIKIFNLMYTVAQIPLSDLHIAKIKVEKLSYDDRYNTFRYQIKPDGSLVEQSSSEVSSTVYELVMKRAKQQPFQWYFDGVHYKSEIRRQQCQYIPLLVNPFDSSIFNEQGKKVFNCNGVLFQPDHVKTSMSTAADALHEGLADLQLSLPSKTREGYPIPFGHRIFTIENTWMFPILPGTNSVYTHGNLGNYWVIITGSGDPVGVVYLKTQEQYSQETKRTLLWTKTPIVHTYGVCEVRDVM